MSWQLVTAANLVMALAYATIVFIVLRQRARNRERERQQQALEINDNIVQGLARVKWALEAHRSDEAHAAADETLAEAQKMVTDLLMSQSPDGVLSSGRLRRDAPAGAQVPLPAPK